MASRGRSGRRQLAADLVQIEFWANSAGLDGTARTKALVSDLHGLPERHWDNFDIFGGTEQILQLVISRAISGLRIE